MKKELLQGQIKKRGYFEQTYGETIFLDEVGELTSAVQVKLLRVLEKKQSTA